MMTPPVAVVVGAGAAKKGNCCWGHKTYFIELLLVGHLPMLCFILGISRHRSCRVVFVVI